MEYRTPPTAQGEFSPRQEPARFSSDPLHASSVPTSPRGVGGLSYAMNDVQPFVPADQRYDDDSRFLGHSQDDHAPDDEFEKLSTHSRVGLTPPPPMFDGFPMTAHTHYDTSTGSRTQRTEKGYRSPRNSSPSGGGHERSASGLGNWAGPARGASPYGKLGHGNAPSGGASGATSAANSSPNLLTGGDASTPRSNAFSRFVLGVYDSSFLVRWIIYIIPVLALIWIPGIVGLTAKPNTRIWGVVLFWWSAYLSVVWVAWWGSALGARLAPPLLRNTLGVVSPSAAHYIDYVEAIQFYIGAATWALISWVTIPGLVVSQASNPNPSAQVLSLVTKFLFGLFIVFVLLLAEKLLIQVIARGFHQKSYEDRIIEMRFLRKTLTTLYANSHDIGRRDTLDGANRPSTKRQVSDPTLLVKKALHGAKRVAQTATSVIGNVASEISGEKVLQPNSPAALVDNALGSGNKSKQLARRIFYSFAPSYRKSLVLEDIAKFFESREVAERAFIMFDRDGNGDATLDEVEMACLDVHRERKAIASSMRDIDSAVGRLDSIIVSLWYIVSIIIIVGLLDASFQTMIAGAGTLLLGLSWLFALTAQEILASIIFVFIKHVYDVGDRVDIDGESYVVKEMALLSTIFRRTDGKIVQAPHSILNTKFIQNVRRSGPITESFAWDVDFITSLEKIEALRERMLEFLELERRDFLPKIDISVRDFSGQAKLSLSADICYKSNWQNGALKVQRRNKWCCALKLCMASLEIYGPDGAGNPSPPEDPPIAYTVVPYLAKTAVQKAEEEREKEGEKVTKQEFLESAQTFSLESREGVVDDVGGDDIFSDDEGDGMGMRRRTAR